MFYSRFYSFYLGMTPIYIIGRHSLLKRRKRKKCTTEIINDKGQQRCEKHMSVVYFI